MNKDIHIFVCGDFYSGDKIEKLFHKYGTSSVFNDLLPIIRDSDFSILNLEAPLLQNGVPISKTGPALKISPYVACLLKEAGFNLLTLANNHILDYGINGIRSTIQLCSTHQLDFLGAGENFKEASKTYYKRLNNLICAFINIAENEWSTTVDNNPGAHPLNLPSNYYTIKEAKKNADFVVVIVHGGLEMYPLPSPQQKSTFRFFIDVGADVVFTHHSHCYSGFEIYNGKPIFYGLGNFLFESSVARPKPWYTGIAVLLKLAVNKPINFELIPITQDPLTYAIRLLKDKKSFDENLTRLNKIIQDDYLLENEFDFYVRNIVSSMYKSFLEPIDFFPIRILQRFKLLPSFLSLKKKRLHLNLIRCESHREVVTKLLTYDCHQ